MKNEDDKLLTAKEFQAILKCSPAYPYRLADAGRIASLKIPMEGNSDRMMLRFKKADVDEFLREHYGYHRK